MIITESLAKGLCSRFFDEAQTQISDQIARLPGSPSKHSRASWLRSMKALEKTLKHFTIESYYGGSKRHPYFALCGLRLLRGREYNTWSEKCLGGLHVLLTYDYDYFDGDAGFFIGEHAIARLIERGKLNILTEKGAMNSLAINHALTGIPFWAGYWFRLFIGLNLSAEQIQHIQLLIPSKNGIFLGQLGQEETSGLDRPIFAPQIRTFVDLDSLSNEQSYLRKALLDASVGLTPSSLSMFPSSEVYMNDSPEILQKILEYRFAGVANLLVNLMCSRVPGEQARNQLKETIMSGIKCYAPESTKFLSDLVHSHGVREVQKRYLAHRLNNAV